MIEARDLDPYAYAKGDPSTLSDPTGTSPDCGARGQNCDGSKQCFVAVGVLNIPCTYNGGNIWPILNLYNTVKSHENRGHSPAGDFETLRDACEEQPRVCGSKLTMLLIAAGPWGTAGAGDGHNAPSAVNLAGEQLLNNVLDITEQLGNNSHAIYYGGPGNNNAVGRMGQMATQARLEAAGYEVQQEVTFKTADGVPFRVDFIALKDGEYAGWEVKTEGQGQTARLTPNEEIGYGALARGEEVYPVGANALKIGLRPGVGIWFRMYFDVWDRPEGY